MKYRMLLVVICGLLALETSGTQGMSQVLQGQESSYQALSDKFFDLMKQGKASDPVDYMFGTNPALAKMREESEQLKSQFASVGTLMGPYVSHPKLLETR